MDIQNVTLTEKEQINLICKLGSISHKGDSFIFDPKEGLYTIFGLPSENWVLSCKTLASLVSAIIDRLIK